MSHVSKLIIDGSSLMHRVHWMNASRQVVSTTSTGLKVYDVYLFLNVLKSYIKEFTPVKTYVVWDKKLLWPSVNFRKQNCEQYKQNRDHEKAKEVYEQEAILTEMLKLLGICNFYPYTLEADDVIAWLCKQETNKNVIISMDKDLYQLISNNTVFYHPTKLQIIDLVNFEQIVKVPYNDYLIYKAIIGDNSDNIEGISGFGHVRAKKLAITYREQPNTIDKSYLDIIEKNLKLMDLNQGYIIAGPDEEQSYNEQFNQSKHLTPDLKMFKNKCNEYEFNSFLKKFSDWESLFSNKQSILIDLINSLK